MPFWNGMQKNDQASAYYQVIGSKDKLFKTKRMLQPSVIEGAGHFITFELPDEISQYVNRRIDQLIETMG